MISKYVDNKELKRLIEDGGLKPFRLKKLLKGQGIILTSINVDALAEQIYPILWGAYDIEQFKYSIDDGGNYLKSAIVELYNEKDHNEKDHSIMDDIENFFNGASYGNSKFRLSSMKKIDDESFIINMKYPIVRLGRNELVAEQIRSIDIIISKKDSKRVIMDMRQVSASEIKELNSFLNQASYKDPNVKAQHLSLSNLTKEHRVEFFDTFNTIQFKGWRFVTITKVELKKDLGDDDSKEINEEDGEDALSNLQGITSAILNGTSIRNNSFVQDCIKNQFSIVTMGYKFESLVDAVKVIIEINFKYDDMKIDICKTEEYDTIEGKFKSHPIIIKRQEDILTMFQGSAYKIYKDIFNKQIEDNKV